MVLDVSLEGVLVSLQVAAYPVHFFFKRTALVYKVVAVSNVNFTPLGACDHIQVVLAIQWVHVGFGAFFVFDYVTSLVFCQLILVVSQLFLEFVFVSDYLLRTEFYLSSFGVVKVVVKAIE